MLYLIVIKGQIKDSFQIITVTNQNVYSPPF